METGYYLMHEESGEWYNGAGEWTHYTDGAYRYETEESAVSAEPYCHDKHVRVYKVELIA